MDKPALGLSPPFTFDGYKQRMEEIMMACVRFMHDYKKIPQKWIDEYNLLSELINEGIDTTKLKNTIDKDRL